MTGTNKMEKQYDRRKVMESLASTAIIGSLAGCSGDSSGSSGSSGPSGPSEDAQPIDLLPETPDGWTQETASSELNAGMVQGEAGARGVYYDESENRYSVEIIRWSSAEDAEEIGSDTYSSGWAVFVTNGNFGFAGNGSNIDKLIKLLKKSSALTEQYIENNRN